MSSPGNTTGVLQTEAVKLSPAQIKMLLFVADNGRARNEGIPFDERAYRPDARTMVRDMIVAPKEVLIVREFVAHAAQLRGDVRLCVTEKGWAIVEALRKATASPTQVQAT